MSRGLPLLLLGVLALALLSHAPAATQNSLWPDAQQSVIDEHAASDSGVQEYTSVVSLSIPADTAVLLAEHFSSSTADDPELLERCDTAPLTHAERHAAEAHIKAFLAARGPVALSTDPINVGIYFHVISNSTGHGTISDSAIAAQIAVLNTAFAGNFNFTLLSTDRTVSNQWFVQSRGSPPDLAAKQALSKGSRRHLNVYTAETVGFLGWAWLPSQLGSRQHWHDGVVMMHGTVPGGPLKRYNLGYTLVHEVGHFLGLEHTFENGCNGVGDGVVDTAPEREAAKGCPTGRDTCQGGGLDPIDNFLDYSEDSCMQRFTPGQFARMRMMWAAYREGQ